MTCIAMVSEPGPPGPLLFVVTSVTSLNVTWEPPAQPNGVIQQYEISHYQDIFVDGKSCRVSSTATAIKIKCLRCVCQFFRGVISIDAYPPKPLRPIKEAFCNHQADF